MQNKILDPLEKQKIEEDLFVSEREAFYSCLTKEQKLLVFCEIISKLSYAELVEGKTYRGILYETFGFDYDAYQKAQLSGFLELHEKINTKQKINLLDFSIRLLNAYDVNVSPEEIGQLINKLDQ